jgi:hypothetical protein
MAGVVCLQADGVIGGIPAARSSSPLGSAVLEYPQILSMENRLRAILLHNHGIKPGMGPPHHERVDGSVVFNEQASPSIEALMGT